MEDNTQPQFVLVDDGTLDTVVRATCCGKEYRFNYQSEFEDNSWDAEETDPDEAYDQWISNHIDNLREEHECDDSAAV